MTTVVLLRKKLPSQVAQVDTPKPRNFCSLGSPSQRALAPVATMTASAIISSWLSTMQRNGRWEKSTLVTMPVRISVPTRKACCRISSMMTGPDDPSG